MGVGRRIGSELNHNLGEGSHEEGGENRDRLINFFTSFDWGRQVALLKYG